jgi:hypothetical protein
MTSAPSGRRTGPIFNAGALENMAMLWIQVAMSGGAGRHFAFQIVGRA